MNDLTKLADGKDRFRLRQGAVSIAVHVLVLLVAVGFFRHAPTIAPSKLPGASHGVQLLTYYAGGSPERTVSALAAKAAEKPKLETNARIARVKSEPVKSAATVLDQGAENAAQSGLGDGQINMAQLTYFPHPKPDLSSLPHGLQGDVVLDAIIDENGKIAELTLLKGLGKSVDDQVIAAVREWTYRPATKNGAPVPSEQELHFHYERA